MTGSMNCILGGGRYVPNSSSSTGAAGGQSNYDPFTGSGRYVPDSRAPPAPKQVTTNQDPFTGSGRYVPNGGVGGEAIKSSDHSQRLSQL